MLDVTHKTRGQDRRPAPRMRNTLAMLLTAGLGLSLATSPALAVHAGHWVHDSEADFTAGKTENTVVTNLGDIKLAAKTQVIGEIPEEHTIIYDMVAADDGSVYLAAGPQGAILLRENEKITPLLTLDSEQIFTLARQTDGRLLVGVSGEKSRLATLEKDNTLKTIVDLPDTRYIWDMHADGNTVYLATGTRGRLLKLDLATPDKPVVTVLYDSAQANLLCMAVDKQGRIFAGSDTDGLVYRITLDNQGQATAFVVYDADEPEIGAIWLADDGTLYVGTADADQARPGRLEAASRGGQGRPASATSSDQSDDTPLQPDKPGTPPEEAPKPGDIPQVPPAPKPIEPPDDTPSPAPEKPAPSAPADDNPEDAPTNPAESKPQAPATPAVADPMRQVILGLAERPAEHPGDDGRPGSYQQAGEAQPAMPQSTQAQRDELRQVISQRLMQARQSGRMQAEPGASPAIARRSPAAAAAVQRARSMAGSKQKQGNAVYRISPEGFVSEVFRESVMILNITGLDDGTLLIATGNEGRLFSISPSESEITRLVKLEPKQITAILPGPDQALFLATANPATLVSFSPRFTQTGTFTSVVLDASQISLFGQLHIVADMPGQSSIAIQTRSGNVSDPENGPWSPWSEPVILTGNDDIDPLTPRSMPIKSPPARFLQYQLTLESAAGQSPQVNLVDASFVVPNLKPSISSVVVSLPGTPPRVTAGPANPSQPQPIARAQRMAGPAAAQAASGGASPVMNITWEAADPNNDQLIYTLEYRPAKATVWLPLAKDIRETRHEWQTRRVPDGRYVVRVTASDARDNIADAALSDSRQSDPVLIDNTPPQLVNLKTDNTVAGQLTITGRARDALSLIQGIQYVIDAGEEWQYILTSDLIYDSTDESFTVKISDLAPGQHVITLRAQDVRGNAVHESLIVQIK